MLTDSDLRRFNDVFIEEAAEHLAEMERLLLALDLAAVDPEELNALFRAAHSIKGGAGIFGFADLMEVTHHLESLLDRFRTGEAVITAPLVDLCLAAADVVAMQLGGHRDGSPVDQAAVEEVCRRLLDATGSVCAATVADDGATEASSGGSYEIFFKPGAETLKRGIRIEGLFAELAELGSLSVTADFPEVDELEGFDPELCHSRWRLYLDTDASEDAIRDIFEFVADDADLIITRAAAEESLPADERRDTACAERVAATRAAREPADSSIRIALGKVDQLVNQVGELVITQAMLAQLADSLDPVQFETLHRGLLQLQRNTRDLQESVMGIRLVPIGTVFSRFPRLVRDLAGKLGKKVALRIQGEATELDRGLIERITDPLTHLVRNSLDHGIESPEARAAAGKPVEGTITLKASQVGGRIVIDVTDDGAGLNRAKILRRAAERGLPVSDAMTDDEVWHLIFSPGFSTAESVTDISGRGVGMDVVMKNVQAMGGRVQIFAEEGQGARFVLSLPLTLAILDGLSVGVGGERFIIPLNAIIESFQPRREDVQTVQGTTRVVNVRGDYVPIIPLREVFSVDTPDIAPEAGVLVMVDAEGTRAALLVNELLGQHQVVIKSLEENYRKVAGTAGASILGDGAVALILDVGEVMELSRESQFRDPTSDV